MDVGVNYIDLQFSKGVSSYQDLNASEPLDGLLSTIVITPINNDYKTPLKFELLLNGEPTNQIITIPPLSSSSISANLNQPFHKGDSLIWHALDTVPSSLKINTYTVIVYNNP